jgi:hypothetical protein
MADFTIANESSMEDLIQQSQKIVAKIK